jgi:ATP-dependent DNA helicase Rep
MFEASLEDGLKQYLTGQRLQNVIDFSQWIVQTQDNLERADPVETIRTFIRQMNYDDWLYESSPSPKAAEMRMKNVSQLFTWITQMLEGNDDNDPMSLPEAVSKLALRDLMERNEEEEEADQVQLMTLHSSKGLEFPYVYMVGMEEGFLPHQVSIDEDGVEEERRLAYVGITRAQRELTFTLCKERRQYGEVTKPEPSRFLYELPQDDLEWEVKKKPQPMAENQQTGKKGLADLRAMLNKSKP